MSEEDYEDEPQAAVRIRKLQLRIPQLDILLESIAKGFTFDLACDRAKISRRAVGKWRDQGEMLLTAAELDEGCELPLDWEMEGLPGSATVDLSGAMSLSDRDSVYVAFALALREARAMGADHHIDVVTRSANDGNEKASMWCLEHLFGMGVRGNLAITKDGKPVEGFAVLALPDNGR